MNIREYQGKEILRSVGVAVPEGRVAFVVKEAMEEAKELNLDIYVVEAQIHVGGRGKAGGVKIAKSSSGVETYAKELLGKTLVTCQTGPEGKEIKRLYIEKGCAIQKEYYVGFVTDRATDQVTLMASEEGGTEIEEVAARTPEKIFKRAIDPVIGLSPFQARRIAFDINTPKESVNKAAKFLLTLCNVFIEGDCSIVEINPLATTADGDVLTLDAKINFDGNALFRHEGVIELRDLEEEDPKEIRASKHNLPYITLDDDIRCMVNGAGLAMATMDTINHFGGNPANFLDAGGNITREEIIEASKITLSDENVKDTSVNVFSGIMKCDVIAEDIVGAVREVGLTLPLVVCLEGTNVELGKKILKDLRLAIEPATTMAENARKIVKLVKEAQGRDGSTKMSVFIDKNTKIMVQDITGFTALFRTKQMLDCGTKIVAGVTPGKGGQVIKSVPIFNTVGEAENETRTTISVIHVPALFTTGSTLEAANADLDMVIYTTEHIPVLNMVKVKRYLRGGKARLAGPNCPGVTTADECRIGTMPGYTHKKGHVGVVSRSGTLTYEAVHQLTEESVGQTTAIGIGGDPVNETSFIDVLRAFNEDDETKAVVMIGEIGDTAKEEAAEWIKADVAKPVVDFIGGQTVPPGKRMKHAGTIIPGGKGAAEEKIRTLNSCDVKAMTTPSEIDSTLIEAAKGAGIYESLLTINK